MAIAPPVADWFDLQGKPSDAFVRYLDDTQRESSQLDGVAAKLNVENQTLTGGVTVTSKDLGTTTGATITLDLGDRPQQHYINNGAHTLAPGSIVGSCLLDITNASSAGAITITGWTMVDGDSFTTTNTHKFRCHCSVGQVGSLLIVKAMQ